MLMSKVESVALHLRNVTHNSIASVNFQDNVEKLVSCFTVSQSAKSSISTHVSCRCTQGPVLQRLVESDARGAYRATS